jgi:hypothetical protein
VARPAGLTLACSWWIVVARDGRPPASPQHASSGHRQHHSGQTAGNPDRDGTAATPAPAAPGSRTLHCLPSAPIFKNRPQLRLTLRPVAAEPARGCRRKAAWACRRYAGLRQADRGRAPPSQRVSPRVLGPVVILPRRRLLRWRHAPATHRPFDCKSRYSADSTANRPARSARSEGCSRLRLRGGDGVSGTGRKGRLEHLPETIVGVRRELGRRVRVR